MIRHACLVAAAIAAAPAIAQTPAEALARLMMDACVFDTPTPAVDELMLEGAGFENSSHGDGTAEFEAPSGATLSYAAREGFASCEMSLPNIGEEGFAPLATALAAEIGSAHEVAAAGQAEEGFEWTFPAAEDAVTRTRLALDPTGAAVLTSSTEVAQR